MEKKKKAKKIPLKKSNPLKYHKRAYWGLKVGRWASVFLPFPTILISKWDTYFVSVDPRTHTKMTAGVILLGIVMFIAFYRETKVKASDGSLQNTPLSNTIVWGIVFLLSYLLQRVLQDLTYILGLAFAGQLGGLTFETFAEKQKFYLDQYEKENIHLTAQNLHEREQNDKPKQERQPIE